MRIKVDLHKIFKKYRKEYVDVKDVVIDLSKIPEIAELEREGFVVRDARPINDS